MGWSHRRRLAFTLLFPIAAGAALESCCRLYLRIERSGRPTNPMILDEELGVRMRPGFRGVDAWGLPLRVNRHGLRGAEIETPKPSGRLRVLAVGDSVTYGYGLPEEFGWPNRLEEILRRRGLDAEVVNAGVTSYTSRQGRALLERSLFGLEPDVVLFAFMNNDRYQVRITEADERSVSAAAVDWLVARSAFVRLCVRRGLPRATATTRRPPRPMRPADVGRRREIVRLSPSDPRVASVLDRARWIPVVSLEERAEILRDVARRVSASGAELIFLSFYDHPYHAGSLRTAREALDRGDAAAALSSVEDYFTTAPVLGTAAERLKCLDVPANAIRREAYDALATPTDQRWYALPRRANEPLLPVLTDHEVHRITAAVADEYRVPLIDLRDLAFAHYIDSSHLSERGASVVAARVAARLLARAPDRGR